MRRVRTLWMLAILVVPAGVAITWADRREAATIPAATPPVQRHLVLVTIDSLRLDHLGCYTSGARSTPAIDALAARGVRFERVYAASPSTSPSTASILTGLYPSHHGLRHDLGGRLDGTVKTLAERLQSAGYGTAAVIGSFHLDSDRGLARGFEIYDDAIPGLRKILVAESKERRAGEVIERGLRYLESMPPGKPVFLWLNFFDPHYDYDPPPVQKERFPGSPYEGEVAYLDAQLGGFVNGLRAKGLLERTVILLSGSHGEGLGGSGETGHGIYLGESTIKVPLIIAGPGVARGRSIRAAGSLTDLAPSILDLAGVKAGNDFDGRSLREYLVADGAAAAPDGDPAAARILFSETSQPHQAYGWAPLFAVLQGDRKVVRGRRTMAYDLRADPGEARPLSPSPSWAELLADAGRRIFRSPDPSTAERRRIDQKLEATKFPWDNSPTCVEKENWPDPRDAGPMALQDRLFRARMDSDLGAPGKAARAAEELLEEDPANFTALDLLLAHSMRGAGIGQMSDRIELLQCNYPYRGAGYHYLGHYHLMRNEAVQAISAMKLFAAVEPWNEEADYDLAIIYAGMGRKEEAFAHLENSIRLGADDYDYIRQDARLQALHADPRFRNLMGPVKTGLEKPR